MLFAEYERSSPIKSFTDRLNLPELQVDDISANLLKKVKRNLYQSGKSGFK